MTAHVHAWQPTIAPDYVCTEAGCGAVARRGRHGGGIRVVARDAAEAELHDRTYSMLARTALAEAEGWRRDEGRQGDRSPAVDEHLAGAREEDRRMPTTRHAWDDRDEAALRAAVETVTAEPDDDGPPAGRHPRVLLWHAVAGILLGDGLRVSPDACRTRWALMEERERRAREAAELARQEREDAVRLAAGDGQHADRTHRHIHAERRRRRPGAGEDRPRDDARSSGHGPGARPGAGAGVDEARRQVGYVTQETSLFAGTVRNNIARDLHDDIGSTLSSINIMSQLAIQENARLSNGQENAGTHLKKIANHSASMMEKMSDIVWSINPKNDSIEQVVIKMKEFAAEMLEPKNIDYSFEIEDSIMALKLDVQKRKNIFLIFKEAINNAAKYSEGNKLTASL